MTEKEYIEELQYLVDLNTNINFMGLSTINLKREGKPINSELAILLYLAQKYIRYKKDLKLFKKFKMNKI